MTAEIIPALSFTLHGQLYSKSNNRQLTKNVKSRNIKSTGARECTKFYLQQLKKIWKGKETLVGSIILTVDIYYPDNRSDLDESLLMDILQKAGVIKNDRQIKEKHIYHEIDKRNPRCEIIIGERQKSKTKIKTPPHSLEHFEVWDKTTAGGVEEWD